MFSLDVVGVDLDFFHFNKVFFYLIIFFKFEQVVYKGMGNCGGYVDWDYKS